MIVEVKPGERVCLELGASEVMMHMRLTSKVMEVELLKDGMAQLYALDNGGYPVSFPVLAKEAGIYWDGERSYVHEEDLR